MGAENVCENDTKAQKMEKNRLYYEKNRDRLLVRSRMAYDLKREERLALSQMKRDEERAREGRVKWERKKALLPRDCQVAGIAGTLWRWGLSVGGVGTSGRRSG